MTQIELLIEQNRRIQEQNKLLHEQNKLLHSTLYQGLKQITSQLESNFGCGKPRT